MKNLKSNMAAGLITFTEVAKHQSFTNAAKALHLTTGAVSQQLLQLETQLGFSLFERHSRGIRLTEKGERLSQATQTCFSTLDNTLAEMMLTDQNPAEIRLKLTPSFAYKWLVPRLENFNQQYPDIQIQIFAEGALVDSDQQDFDLAIDYGPIPYHKKSGELLLEEYLLPVMSQAYQNKHLWLIDNCNPNWEEVVLLHDAMPWQTSSRDQEWQHWFSHYIALEQNKRVETHRGHFFNRTDMAMSAAEAGVGIAMARLALIGNELEKGKLVSPFGPIKANAGYYLHCRTSSEAVSSFVEWLKWQVRIGT